MNYSKYGKGWFKESDRHRLARLGIKTGRKTASIGFGLSKINYGKVLSSHEFRINDNTTIVCRSEDTRSGFRHIADLYRGGTLVESAKATYLNRTWEKYEFQSVIKELLNKAKYSETEQDKIMKKVEGKALGKVDTMFKSVGMVASLGEVFGKTEKEKNTWKLRMIKAGLGKSFQEPEDWNTLSEKEKGKRLDKIIKLLKDKKPVNYQKLSQHPQHILNAPLPDKDKDRVPDIYDWDDDNDGVPDWKDTEGMFSVDRFKGKGVFDPFHDSQVDSDFDGIPDIKDLHPLNPHKARDWAKTNYAKLKWKSIHEAPIEKIEKQFKKSYGKKPTSQELQDILLEGEF